MKKWLLGTLGAITVIVLIGVVFLLGRLTGTSTADAADTTTSTSQVPTTTTEGAVTTTTSAPATGDAIALAGEDQIVSVTAEVTLDGSGSSDPNDQELGYVWTQMYGPDVTDGAGTLEGEAPTFPAPDTVSTLVFELTVDDGSISGPDSVVVHVVEDADTAVFIDEGAEVAGVGRGTMDDPFTSIASGIAVAEDLGGADLYLMRLDEGSYVLDSELTLPPNVSLYGGYDGDWLRDPTQPTTMTGPGQTLLVPVDGLYTVLSGLSIIASETSGTSIAAQFFSNDADGGTVRIEDSTLVGGQGDRGSYGVIAEGTFNLSIVRSSITAGAAGKGADGAEAGPQTGAAAIPGRDADERDPGIGYNPGGEGGSALAGMGEDGSGNPAHLGGSGGDAGDDGGDGDQLGGVGGGIGGAGGLRDLWRGEGTAGSDGFHGREGGGGGGGGGKVGLEGGGGGGGGEGGKPGFGGDPGTAGRESIGLYLALEGRVLIEDSDLTGGRGGDGGDGGIGSPGLPGANGGRGDSGSCSFLGCGAGQAGDGGDGRGGGAGSQGGQGGGGAGGPSIGLMIDNGETELSLVGCKVLGGTGGDGGRGGFGGLSAEGSSGRTSGKNLVPGTEAPATLNGADGGSSFGLVFGNDASSDQVTNDDCDVEGTNPGAPGEAPLPGRPGLSEASNA